MDNRNDIQRHHDKALLTSIHYTLGDDEETDEIKALSLMHDPKSLSKESSTGNLVKWIRNLQNKINKLQEKIKGLWASHNNMKTQMLSRIQKQMERDQRTFKRCMHCLQKKYSLQEVPKESK